MTVPKKHQPEPATIINSISKSVGVLLGTAVVAGKRIAGGGSAPVVAKSKTPGKGKKKVAGKRVSKGPKKKKKAVRRKAGGTLAAGEASKKKPVKSPAKKKKIATAGKSKPHSKTKKAANSGPATPG